MDYLGCGSAANLPASIMTYFFFFLFLFFPLPEGIKISTSAHHLGIQTKVYNSMPFIPISMCDHSVGVGNIRAFFFLLVCAIFSALVLFFSFFFLFH